MRTRVSANVNELLWKATKLHAVMSEQDISDVVEAALRRHLPRHLLEQVGYFETKAEPETKAERTPAPTVRRGTGDAELLAEVEAALASKRFTQAALAQGVGLSSAATFRGWRETGRVPGSHVEAVRTFLTAHPPTDDLPW